MVVGATQIKHPEGEGFSWVVLGRTGDHGQVPSKPGSLQGSVHLNLLFTVMEQKMRGSYVHVDSSSSSSIGKFRERMCVMFLELR
jgi:hypothetical protein